MRSSRPTAAEQGEERKVWGSRSCHTQMTDCGGLFSSSFSRNPDALPPHSLFCRLPIVPCIWDSWRRRPAQLNTPHPHPSAHPKAAEPSHEPLDKSTAGQELPVFFSNRAKPQVCLAQKEGAPAARGLGSPKEGPCYGATVSIGAASKGWLPLVAA